ncbi:hypothetical protein BaRGS_00008307 [Batillaria attramentaria]|uniref:Uncharacterized protein n=1 Tax=Batillaria attramentaria TaxID=370345 RepID=A0ABD0LM78_9CAEN
MDFNSSELPKFHKTLNTQQSYSACLIMTHNHRQKKNPKNLQMPRKFNNLPGKTIACLIYAFGYDLFCFTMMAERREKYKKKSKITSPSERADLKDCRNRCPQIFNAVRGSRCGGRPSGFTTIRSAFKVCFPFFSVWVSINKSNKESHFLAR